MSVDLEDYYYRVPYEQWDNYESRVVETTCILLDLFNKYNTRATFFTLGYIAKRHPELIERIVSQGHEIASHGFSHRNIQFMKKEEFESDLRDSIDILRKVSKEKIYGFRAPYYSINKKTFWAFSILKRYLLYDSSIFPARSPRGIPTAPQKIYHVSDADPLKDDEKSSFIEIPLATLHIPLYGNFPIAGGFYLRALPVQIINFGIKQLNKLGLVATCYVHPHDLDPKKPRLTGYPWHAYWRLNSAAKKLEFLLRSFTFSSIREVVELA